MLTTAMDHFVGGSLNDNFNGTFSNGGSNTFNAGDILNGGAGTNSLTINPSIATAATTLGDGLWVGVSNIVGAGANVLKFSRPEIADGFMASGVIRNGNCGGELMGFQIST